jgi:hypothetical protein
LSGRNPRSSMMRRAGVSRRRRSHT